MLTLENLYTSILENKESLSKKLVVENKAQVMMVIQQASGAILNTTEALVVASLNTQKELREKGKNFPKSNVYRKDPSWARSLIKTSDDVDQDSKQFCHDLLL